MFPVSPALVADSLPSSHLGFPGGSAGKEFTWNVGDLGSIPGLGRSHGEGKGYPLQYSGLENSVDCVVLEVTKSQILLSDFHQLHQHLGSFVFTHWHFWIVGFSSIHLGRH